MHKSSYILFYISHGLVVVTGLVYGWMRYFCDPNDPYAVVNHPWQPQLLHAHVLTAPLLVLMIGVFWQTHAAGHWRRKQQEGRRSGLLLWTSALPMIMSGYFIQTAVSNGWRTFWIGMHLVTGLAWLAGSLIHILTHVMRKRTTNL